MHVDGGGMALSHGLDGIDLLNKALRIVAEGLEPWIAARTEEFAPGLAWTRLIAAKDENKGVFGKTYSATDLQVQLRTLTERIGTAGFPYSRHFTVRSEYLPQELRSLRNLVAHNEPFDVRQVRRGLETCQLMLEAIGDDARASDVAALSPDTANQTVDAAATLESSADVLAQAVPAVNLPEVTSDPRLGGLEVAVLSSGTLSYALAYQRLPILRELQFAVSEGTWEGLEISVRVAIDGVTLSAPNVRSIDLSPDAPVTLRGGQARVLLIPESMLAIREAKFAELIVEVAHSGALVHVERSAIRVIPPAVWRSNGSELDAQLLAAHVQPNAPAINELLQGASRLLKDRTGSGSLEGYQSGPERAALIVRAVFDAMAATGVQYAEPPASFTQGQKIRTPREVVAGGFATCLDTSVVMAAALEQAGIQSQIWLIPGHALISYAVEDVAPTFLPVTTDRNTVLNLVDGGHIRLVETTRIPGGTEPTVFDDALLEGIRRVHRAERIDAVLDIAAVRGQGDSGVLPLPSREVDESGNVTIVEYQPAAVLPVAAAPAAQVIVGGKLTRELAPRRVEQWKNALLDLSLRNGLLNFRERSAISVQMPPSMLPGVEDRLHEGGQVALLPASSLDPLVIERLRGGDREALDQHLVARFEQQKSLTILQDEASYVSALRRLSSRAKTVIEETGSNNLYLALGQLVWTPDVDKAPERRKELRAPLILVPITLTSTHRGTQYRIALDEAGGSTPNFCLLEKLKQTFQLEIPDLAEPETDGSGIDLAAAFAATRAAITDAGLPFRVEETAHLAILQFAKFRLWKDLDENWEALAGNPLVRHLIETPTESFTDPVAEAAVDLDDLMVQLPIAADSSQAEAVGEALNGRTFVLEGPPGTGKSQTITNLLAAALHRGKRVLFVAEKRAALEVVKKRLGDLGLDGLTLDLHDKSAKINDVRRRLRESLDATGAADHDAHTLAVERAAIARRGLAQYADAVHSRNGAQYSVYSAHNFVLTVGDETESLPVPERYAAVTAAAAVDEHLAALRELPDVADRARPAPVHPWGFLRRSRPAAPSEVWAAAHQLDTALDALVQRGWDIEHLTRAVVPGELLAWSHLVRAPRRSFEQIDAAATDAWRGEDAAVRQIVQQSANNAPWLRVATPTAFALDPVALHTATEAARTAGFFARGRARKHLGAVLAAALQPGATVPPKELVLLGDALLAAQRSNNELVERLRRLGAQVPAGWHPFDTGAVTATTQGLDWLAWAAHHSRSVAAGDLGAAIRQHFSRTTPETSDATELQAVADSWQSLESLLDLDNHERNGWSGSNTFLAAYVEARVGRSQGGSSRVAAWMEMLDRLQPLRDAGLDEIVEMLLDGRVSADEALLSFRRGLAGASVRERLASTGLEGFDADVQARSIDRYRDGLQRSRDELPRVIPVAAIAHRRFDSRATSGRLGELRRQLGRQRNGLGVRELFAQYGDLIGQIAPCVLTSPEAIARHVPTGLDLFDLVVFDEASQIRVADAIGAMGRAKAVVVVGDSKQMPPTSVAESTTLGEAESGIDDEGTVVDEESILSECVQARVPSRLLSWHYRSQDESLIAFSNHKYYDSRLSSFPAPTDPSSDAGLSVVRVDGSFDRSGVGKLKRTNDVEARAIVAEIRSRIEGDEQASIGVITFNQQQRDYIENLLRDLGDERILHALDRDGEGLFVKNLENVQGDERDVILFSIAFSANEKGVLPLNFGPLSNAGGERRLNVAVTRARRKVVLYSSFDPGDLRVEATSSVGVQHLRSYLELASYGDAAPEAGSYRQPSIDRHRDEIAVALRVAGLAVATDVGLSDFRVDLSVAHPDDPERPLIAVLLDNEVWRRRRSVVDRDSLPLDVLGKLMHWPAVERVWLPTWLADSAAVVASIRETADALRAQTASESTAVDSPTGSPQRDAAALASIVDLRPDVEAEVATKVSEEWMPPLRARGEERSASESSSRAMPDTNVPLFSDDHSVARAAPAESASAATDAFLPWSPRIAGGVDVLDQLPNGEAWVRVREVLAEIILAEAPIHQQRLAKLAASSFGLNRVAESRQKAILRCIPKNAGRLSEREFLVPEGFDAATWTRFRHAGGQSRVVTEISLLEIANAIADAARRLGGGNEADLLREALTVFGGSRMTSGIEERLESAMRLALELGRVRRDDHGTITA